MKTEKHYQGLLEQLYRQAGGNDDISVQALPHSGSDRKYLRLTSGGNSVMGVYNPHTKENLAFLSFTRHFLQSGLAVPDILAEDIPNHIYLLSDLGDDTLFSLISRQRSGQEFPDTLVRMYKEVAACLPVFQIAAGKGLDYSYCYPRAFFDKQSMLWDLNYFKYYFLKLLRIAFDEQELEDDFETFSGQLLSAGCDHFMYRDFQSRNIMIVQGKPFFIDYQGGRRGPLQYDIASLLWDAKADIPMPLREALLDEYISTLGTHVKISEKEFRRQYFSFVYIRIMQALGAYGFRGFYERKEHFLLSIPYAVKNLRWLLEHAPLPDSLPALSHALEAIANDISLNFAMETPGQLTINLCSFSYKNGIPQDLSGHGGGFVFDCRSLPNPGRSPAYASLTGRDKEVAAFLEKEHEVSRFYAHAEQIVAQAVENYLHRGFSRLMVSFGCTGGQHRSVYFAERMNAWLQQKYKLRVNLLHRELKQ